MAHLELSLPFEGAERAADPTSGMERVWAWLAARAESVYRLSLKEDDTPLQRQRKKVLLLTSGTVLMGQLLAMGVLYRNGEVMTIGLVEDVMSVCLLVAVLVYCFVFKRVTDFALAVTAIATLMVIAAVDLQGAARGAYRSWSLMMVTIDLLLVMRAPSWTAALAVVGTTVWMAVIAAEGSMRFGLFDVPGLLPQEDRRKYQCGCETLPCARGGDAWLEFVLAMLVFWVDFTLTRRFATQLYHERDGLAQAVEMGKIVARHLADFDLDAAREALEAAPTTLPQALHVTYCDLLNNLREYRPYLPHSLVHQVASVQAAPVPSAPLQRTALSANMYSFLSQSDLSSSLPEASEEVTAAIMFTDVRKSTSIWRACPKGMQRALTLHNAKVRACLQRFTGYEVKTIGDAFMASFDVAQRAVSCGMEIHEALVQVAWPSRLMQLDECVADAQGIWGGLTLRIGVDYGTMNRQVNEITGRWDYFGDVANRAARIEGVCVPGAVAAREEVMQTACLSLPADAWITVDSTLRMLKGFEESGKVRIQSVTPKSLAGRKALSYAEWSDKAAAKSKALFQELDASDRPCEGDPAEPCTSFMASESPQRFTYLQCVHATVGSVDFVAPTIDQAVQDIESVTSSLNAVFAFVIHEVQIARGAVVATLNDSVLVSWGSGAQAEESGKFLASCLAAVYQPEKDAVVTPVNWHIGMARGHVISGSLGTADLRFMTLLGPCVRLAQYAAQLAAEAKVRLLFAEPVGLYRRALGPMPSITFTLFKRTTLPWEKHASKMVDIHRADYLPSPGAQVACRAFSLLSTDDVLAPDLTDCCSMEGP